MQPTESPVPRRALTVAFCLFLTWRAGASVVSLAREIATVKPRALVNALTLPQEERIRRTLGGDYEMYAALRTHVPEGAFVVLVTERTFRDMFRAMRAMVLLYPRRFLPAARLPDDWQQRAGRPDTKVFVLDTIGEATRPRGSWHLLQGGKTFRLLGPGRRVEESRR